MNNKTLKTGVKIREIGVDGITQILVSSPYYTERKNLIHKIMKKLFTKDKIINTMLYVVCGFFTVVLGYFIGIITGLGELINSLF